MLNSFTHPRVQYLENSILRRIDRTSKMLSNKFGKTVKSKDGSCSYPEPKKVSAHNLRLAR